MILIPAARPTQAQPLSLNLHSMFFAASELQSLNLFTYNYHGPSLPYPPPSASCWDLKNWHIHSYSNPLPDHNSGCQVINIWYIIWLDQVSGPDFPWLAQPGAIRDPAWASLQHPSPAGDGLSLFSALSCKLQDHVNLLIFISINDQACCFGRVWSMGQTVYLWISTHCPHSSFYLPWHLSLCLLTARAAKRVVMQIVIWSLTFPEIKGIH